MTNYTHPCKDHHIRMKKGKGHKDIIGDYLGLEPARFTNIHCIECNKYLKHASDNELAAWDKMTDEERDRVTYGQLYQITYRQVIAYDENNPEEYIKSFPEHTLWLNIPFAEKDEAKKMKAGIQWDPYVKVWHTTIFNENAIKLKQWMFPADIQRVIDYQNQSKQERQVSLKKSFIRPKLKVTEYVEEHPRSYWDKAYKEHMENKLTLGEPK
jgi:hypothetical protein